MKDLRQLRTLDDRIVPVVAARVARWSHALADRRTGVGAWFKAFDVRSLRGLDERYAVRGPFALLRDVPQVGFVLIGLVFLAATGTAVTRDAEQNRQAQQQTVVDAGPTLPGGEQDTGSRTLGPAVGDNVLAYQAASTQGLVAAQPGSGNRVALISLRGYLTPGQLKDLLDGYQVQRIYLRSRSGGKDAAQLPVNVSGNLASTLVKAYEQAAQGRRKEQQDYQGYVDTLTVTTKEDQAFKDLYASFAHSTGREASDYQHSCACVYAVVVSGSVTSLATLATKPGVRAVEVAPKGINLAALEIAPLLPEVTGVVPQAQAQATPP